MKIDNTLSAVANVYKQLNADNPLLTATEANITLGVPAERTAGVDQNNTSILLTAVAGQGFKNSTTVTYMRLELDANAVAPATELFIQPGDDLADVKALIAASWELIESDFSVTGAVPTNPGQSTIVTLSVVADSLVYIESAPALTVTISIESVDLNEAVGVKQLTGFNRAS